VILGHEGGLYRAKPLKHSGLGLAHQLGQHGGGALDAGDLPFERAGAGAPLAQLGHQLGYVIGRGNGLGKPPLLRVDRP